MKKPTGSRTYTPGERQIKIYDYIRKNASKEHPLPLSAIKDYVENFDGKISVTTLYKDIEKISNATGTDIIYDEKNHGYYMANPPFTSYDLWLMVDSIQKSHAIPQGDAKKLVEKIATHLADRHTAADLMKQATGEKTVPSSNDSIAKNIETIKECLRQGKKVSFKYFQYVGTHQRKRYENEGKPYVFSPHDLRWERVCYALYGYIDGQSRSRRFLVERMEDVRLYREPRVSEKELKEKYGATPIKYLRTTRQAENVRLYCDNKWLAPAIVHRFGKDVIIIPDGDGFSVSATTMVDEDFCHWVAVINSLYHIKITHPKSAVDYMREYLEHYCSRYNEVLKMYNDE